MAINNAFYFRNVWNSRIPTMAIIISIMLLYSRVYAYAKTTNKSLGA